MGRGLVFTIMIISIIVLFLSIIPSTSAIAIGVNKAEINFVDVLRNGYAEDTFVVSTDTDLIITGDYEVEGDIAPWIRFEPENFTFSASSPARVKVIIEPPEDVSNGDYGGFIRVLTGEIARADGGRMGTSARAAFKINVALGITGVEKRSCILGGVKLKNTEIRQPVDLSYSIKNTGNVRVQPEILIQLYDQDENFIDSETLLSDSDVLPTTIQEFFTQFENGLNVGQYWAKVSSPDCAGGSYMTFDVLERGGISDSGELVKINVDSWVNVGDIVPITAVFKNKGSRTVSAKFKGSIMKGKKLVKIIDTDFYNTPPGEVANIETFFNPDAPGQYEVKGRVLYNNKLTFERSSIINVNGSALTKDSNYIPLFIIVLVIIILLLIIRKKKKRF